MCSSSSTRSYTPESASKWRLIYPIKLEIVRSQYSTAAPSSAHYFATGFLHDPKFLYRFFFVLWQKSDKSRENLAVKFWVQLKCSMIIMFRGRDGSILLKCCWNYLHSSLLPSFNVVLVMIFYNCKFNNNSLDYLSQNVANSLKYKICFAFTI